MTSLSLRWEHCYEGYKRERQLQQDPNNTSLGYFNQLKPIVVGVKFSLREIRRSFPIQLRNFRVWKIQYLNY